MALGLTQEEEEARRRVQLPYEHQGQVRVLGRLCSRLT